MIWVRFQYKNTWLRRDHSTADYIKNVLFNGTKMPEMVTQHHGEECPVGGLE